LKAPQTLGRSVSKGTPRKMADVTTSSRRLRTYQREVERQKIIVKKAELTQQRLLFVISALRQFFADENFINLLRAEGLDTLPEYLADRVWSGGEHGMSKVSLGFIPDALLVPLEQILPSRKTPAGLITSVKFKQIRSSIEDVGLIEPLVRYCSE
jgi:hypothetical protein